MTAKKNPLVIFTAVVLLVLVVAASVSMSTDAPLVFRGTCDASAAVQLDEDMFAVANDEDNLLRFYRLSQPGDPIETYSLGPFLFGKKKGPESDLEASARIENRVYWITSHAPDSDGNPAPHRQLFFALDIERHGSEVTLRPTGRVYRNLLDDLLREPYFARLGISSGAVFNIEGMTDTPEGGLLIGFRSPTPDGRALIIPMLNPGEVIGGSKPTFGAPLLLDLDGRGLRGMGSIEDGYYLIAGPSNGGGTRQLYFWAGGRLSPTKLGGLETPGINPEGIVFHDDHRRPDFYILSDDGGLNMGGKDCKKLPKTSRQFRAYRIQQ